MRSSGGRLRPSGRRRSGLAAPLIVAALVLAACGDNLDPPRLTAARYVYTDGASQIDHNVLYDLELQTLCEPTLFSDGATYCAPPTDAASFADDKCIRPIGRVPAGQAPKPYFATTYTLNNQRSPSRIYRIGSPRAAPLARYERLENQCVASPLDDGFDYYELGAEITELPRVHFEKGDVVGSWHVNELVADGLRMPWRLSDATYGECDVLQSENLGATHCHPWAAVEIAYYSDSNCYVPIITTASSRPPLAYNGNKECAAYFEPGNSVVVDTLYQHLDHNCVPASPSGPVHLFTVGPSMTLPSLFRQPESSSARLWRFTLSPTPLEDEIMNDTKFGQACRRDAEGTCLPVDAASVESWFADASCTQPIDLAMVGRPCGGESKFARNGDTFYRVLDVYTERLYQLSTGDTCQIYNPPAPFVAHSIGPALGEDAFARATLMIE